VNIDERFGEDLAWFGQSPTIGPSDPASHRVNDFTTPSTYVSGIFDSFDLGFDVPITIQHC
jgi:hypothetical protein